MRFLIIAAKKVAYLTKVPGHVIFILREKVPYVHLQATVGGSEQYRIGGASYYATASELEKGATNKIDLLYSLYIQLNPIPTSCCLMTLT